MKQPKRPWLVEGRSNEWEQNGRVAKRFVTQEQALRFADYAREELCWDRVRVIYSEVRP